MMIWWLILLWSIIGALVTARIERGDDTFDDEGRRTYHLEFEWRFNVEHELLQLLLAGPQVWAAIALRPEE